MDPHDVRKWAENHRAAAAREAQETRKHPLTAEESFAAAMALLNWDEQQNGSPFERYDPRVRARGPGDVGGVGETAFAVAAWRLISVSTTVASRE